MAQAVSTELAAMQPSAPLVKCITGDIRKPLYSDATVIYFCNVVFDLQMQSRVMEAMLRCPNLRLVIAAAPLVHPRLVRLGGFLGDCTWGSGISIGLYRQISQSEVGSFALASTRNHDSSHHHSFFSGKSHANIPDIYGLLPPPTVAGKFPPDCRAAQPTSEEIGLPRPLC